MTVPTEESEKDLYKSLHEMQTNEENIMKQISLLDTLSNKLKYAIGNEDHKIRTKQANIMREEFKNKVEGELALLDILNTRTERYLAIIDKRNELELEYLKKVCEHTNRVNQLKEQFPTADLKTISSGGDAMYKDIASILKEIAPAPVPAPQPPQQSAPQQQVSVQAPQAPPPPLTQAPFPPPPPPPTQLKATAQLQPQQPQTSSSAPKPRSPPAPNRPTLQDQLSQVLEDKFKNAKNDGWD